MRKVVVSVLVLTLVSGCSRISDSRMNPMNWFDRDTSESETTIVQDVPPIIPVDKIPAQPAERRALIENLEAVEVRDVAGGVLVTAQGRIARRGGFNLQLVREGVTDGILTLAFRVQYPQTQTAASTQLVTVAQFLSEKEMRGVRGVQVRAANGSTIRRN